VVVVVGGGYKVFYGGAVCHGCSLAVTVYYYYSLDSSEEKFPVCRDKSV
jgi:hypothetical protein